MNNPNYKTIDEYIALCAPEVQPVLHELRTIIRNTVPLAVEKISWAMPTFYQNGNLVHFAAHKNHIGFYPGVSGVEVFKDELTGFNYSKGAIQFPLGQPLPHQLIVRIVSYRLHENNAKAAQKKSKKR